MVHSIIYAASPNNNENEWEAVHSRSCEQVGHWHVIGYIDCRPSDWVVGVPANEELRVSEKAFSWQNVVKTFEDIPWAFISQAQEPFRIRKVAADDITLHTNVGYTNRTFGDSQRWTVGWVRIESWTDDHGRITWCQTVCAISCWSQAIRPSDWSSVALCTSVFSAPPNKLWDDDEWEQEYGKEEVSNEKPTQEVVIGVSSRAIVPCKERNFAKEKIYRSLAFFLCMSKRILHALQPCILV